jgi:hypothetical protein
VQSFPESQLLLSEPGPPSSQTPSEAMSTYRGPQSVQAAQHVSKHNEEAVFPEIEEDAIVTAMTSTSPSKSTT